MLAGVDEAGRGPVLGPLVVAAVMVEDDASLRELGVKDSKQLSPKKREALAPLIRETVARHEVRVVEPAELNARMPHVTLNQIEVEAFGELLDRLQPTQAVLDACDVDAERFGRNVGSLLKTTCDIRAMHGADADHPVVAAASILAKVERDRLVQVLQSSHGDCGSGYASDARTRAFLEAWIAEKGSLPAFARHQWETCKRLVRKDHSLLDF